MQRLSIPISALNHYAFCPRRCAYIHIEQVWADNYFTAKGNQLHERVHSSETETRGNIRTERGVEICSEVYGIHGKLDLLEINRNTGDVTPIEYKKGKPKIEDCDRVQLCAQVLCLEEMTNQHIDKAAMWYWKIRRREWVEIDDALRTITKETIKSTRKLFNQIKLPKAIYTKSCRPCSFFEKCLPQHKDHSNLYVKRMFCNEETT